MVGIRKSTIQFLRHCPSVILAMLYAYLRFSPYFSILPNDLRTLLIKVGQAAVGLFVGHIVARVLYGKIHDWTDDSTQRFQKIMRIALVASFVVAISLGI